MGTVLDLFEDDEEKEEVADLFPFVREGVSDKDGKIYAWWWNTDLRVLYRRTDMVPTAPVTWDELKAAGVASTKKGMEGVVFNGGRYEGAIIDWLSNYWDLGGKLGTTATGEAVVEILGKAV